MTPEAVSALLRAQGVRHWLIGGHAAELVCGHSIRAHEDTDFFLHADDAAGAVALLSGHGFAPVHGSLEAGDLFLRRGDTLLDLVPIRPHPPRTLGALADLRWPAGLLDPCEVRGVPTLTPAMQLAMKAAVAGFYGLPLRAKDEQDVAALRRLYPSA